MINLISIKSFSLLSLVEQKGIVTALAITVAFFLILLILGVRKSYKLKKENEKLLNDTDALLNKEAEEYTDFTDSHLYK